MLIVSQVSHAIVTTTNEILTGREEIIKGRKATIFPFVLEPIPSKALGIPSGGYAVSQLVAAV